jgi:hypothetical protein
MLRPLAAWEIDENGFARPPTQRRTSGLDVKDLDSAQSVLRALGHEALTENCQWLIQRRAWPQELHIGG